MASILLSGKEYPLPENAAAFLKSYLERVRRYVELHSLGAEYAQDIENRIAEKLDPLGSGISEKDAVKIVNDL